MNYEGLALGRIDRLSRVVRGACYFIALLIIVLQFGGGNVQPLFLNADMSLQYMNIPDNFEAQTEFKAMPAWPLFVVGVISSLLFLFVLYQLERLFACYQKHIFYVQKNNQRLRNIGIALVSIALLQPLKDIVVYFLSRDIAVPEALAAYTVDLSLTLDFPLFVIGLVFIAIASVLTGALRLQEEAELTI